MPLLTVITAVAASRGDYLVEAGTSLLTQDLPSGWDLEWHIQVDGDGATPAVVASFDDPRVTVRATGTQQGPGGTRNTAVRATDGDVVKILDADDLLTPGQLQAELPLYEDPSVGFVVSHAADLHPSGRVEKLSAPHPEGFFRRGELYEHWAADSYRLSVHPATLSMRRDLFDRLGGWMEELPSGEDTGLLLTANCSPDGGGGYMLDRVGLHYRLWDGQMNASPDYNRDIDRRREYITSRCEHWLRA